MAGLLAGGLSDHRRGGGVCRAEPPRARGATSLRAGSRQGSLGVRQHQLDALEKATAQSHELAKTRVGGLFAAAAAHSPRQAFPSRAASASRDGRPVRGLDPLDILWRREGRLLRLLRRTPRATRRRPSPPLLHGDVSPCRLVVAAGASRGWQRQRSVRCAPGCLGTTTCAPTKEGAFWAEEAAALRLRLTELLIGTEPDAAIPGPSSPKQSDRPVAWAHPGHWAAATPSAGPAASDRH
jgi:hypothetical protein